MAYMILEVELQNGAAATLEGPNIKFWLGQGLPDYDGSIGGFAEAFPEHMEELKERNLVREC